MATMQAVKTVVVKVSFTGWDYDDTYTMQSPTGRTLRIKPNGHWSHGDAQPARKLTEEEEAVLNRISAPCRDGSVKWDDKHDLIVTHHEMALFASAARKCWNRRT